MGLGSAHPLPTLSSVGASLAGPCFRLHTPLIDLDLRIARIRLWEKISRCRPQKTTGQHRVTKAILFARIRNAFSQPASEPPALIQGPHGRRAASELIWPPGKISSNGPVSVEGKPQL
jgi:hypothetical protein